MAFTTNPELELAFDFIQNTNKNIFLTGKAGTGKTTFLHRIKEESIKRLAVVAPTGVAAINARGMTIHSLFQLPFTPFIPGNTADPSRQRKFSKKKIDLIRSLDLLIIDEISMVRCDILDAIDDVLRRYKDRMKPFGGVQLLMIGDLHQLPPVVREDTWDMLRQHYSTPYFFGSNALQGTHPITIQLTHIYRQSDEVFINLLNKVRDNQMDKEVLETLNSRYIPDFSPPEDEPYITLTSHNKAANKINEKKLKELPGVLKSFKAKIDGDFPEHAFPTEMFMEFKLGAQVMFIKNDLTEDKRFYNGKIGQITGFGKDCIYVKCPGDTEEIAAEKMDWENVKFELDEKTKEVSETVKGTFTQYPLRLAWAITIHKSQGLTFERAVIDAQSAFAHGQVYVALSRCTSFEGIVLHSPINFNSVRTDTVVKNYSSEAERNAPTEEDLIVSKRQYQRYLIRELFTMTEIKRALAKAERVFFEHEKILSTTAVNQFKEWSVKAENLVFGFAEKFQPQLNNYFLQDELPENNQGLQGRIQKGSVYFLGKLQDELLPDIKKIPIITDNASVKKLAVESKKALEKAIFVKNACFTTALSGFFSNTYLKAIADAEMDFDKKKSFLTKQAKTIAPSDSPHPKLYIQIKDWRDDVAEDEGKKPYEVFPVAVILELTCYLPTTTPGLLRIKGLGKLTVGKYAYDIIPIIEDYCKKSDIPTNLMTALPSKKRKKDTKELSLEIFKTGKNIDEVAEARGMVRTTIEGHLAHFVEQGDIDLLAVLERSKAEELIAYFDKNKGKTSKDAKDFFGDKYSYGDLKLVRAHLKGMEED